ncbi:hypothetical protein B7H17_11525 [Pseudomonas putida]|uniref:Uncharacterized protein n=1 Tax=Pseudomonas putida TaxID=303 RepID=A0A1X0ZYZ9_PSEPU|nr:hypothetical protein B7H17_11525 [Pseudomonas putida]
MPASLAPPHNFGVNRSNYIFETGFFCKNAGLFSWPNFCGEPHDRSSKHPLCQIARRNGDHRVEGTGTFLGEG